MFFLAHRIMSHSSKTYEPERLLQLGDLVLRLLGIGIFAFHIAFEKPNTLLPVKGFVLTDVMNHKALSSGQYQPVCGLNA